MDHEADLIGDFTDDLDGDEGGVCNARAVVEVIASDVF